MSNSTVAKRGDGRVPRAGILRGSNSPTSFAFAKMLAPHRLFLLNSEASIGRALVSVSSKSSVVTDVRSLNHHEFLFNKVLRFWQKGQCNSPNRFASAVVSAQGVRWQQRVTL
jgi:hypothetical protein